jgi:hypothetical protein
MGSKDSAEKTVKVDVAFCVGQYDRSQTERPEGGQPFEACGQIIVALRAIQVSIVPGSPKKPLGSDLRRTDAVNFDKPSGQGRQPIGRCAGLALSLGMAPP